MSRWRGWRSGLAERLPWWLAGSLCAELLVTTAVSATRPTISYRALALGADTTQLGLVAAAFAALPLACAIPLGRWVDRWGELRFVLTGSALVAAAAFALAAAGSLATLGLLYALLGLGHVMLQVAVQALLANTGAPSRRDQRFGALTVATSCGQLIGPAVAGALADDRSVGPVSGLAGTRLTFVLAGLSAALGILGWAGMAARLRRERRRQGARPAPGPVGARPSIISALRGRGIPQALLVSMAVLSSVDILIAYLPAYGEATGLPAATVGLLLAARSGASLTSRLVLTALIGRLGRRRVIVLSAAVPALTLAAFPLLDSVPALFLLIGVAGAGLGLGQPLSLAWVAGSVAREIRGTALGVRLTGNRLAQLVVPGGVGVLAGAFGVASVFWCLSVMLAASAAAASRAPRG